MFGLSTDEFKSLQRFVRAVPESLNMRSWEKMMILAYLQNEGGSDRMFPPGETETAELIRKYASVLAKSFSDDSEAINTLWQSLKDAVSLARYREAVHVTSKAFKIEPSQHVVFLKLPAHVLQVLVGQLKIRTLVALSERLSAEGFINKNFESLVRKALEAANPDQGTLDFKESAA